MKLCQNEGKTQNGEDFALDELSIQERIAEHYSGLSGKLQEAADFVVANPFEVATRSLRAVSAASGLAPATFTRLSRSLGFSSYEDMRELCRTAIGQGYIPFSKKAGALQAAADKGDSDPVFTRHMDACVSNMKQLASDVDLSRLDMAADLLSHARRVVVIGAFASTGIAEYLSYLATFFADNWQIAGRMGASPSSALAGLDERDALVIITKPPFARRSILAAQMVAEQGVKVIVITDSYACPALKFASIRLVVPTNSPQFFSSYVTTLMLLETLVAMIVSRAGPKAKARIEEIENRNRLLGEFWEE